MILLWNSAEMNVELDIVDGSERYHYEWRADRMLARDMLKYIRDQLAERGTSIKEVSGIGVYRGPGSFTGLRIGLTVLNTMARSLAVPIIGETGAGWQERALSRIAAHEDDQLVLPLYGSDALVTKPKK